MPPSRRILVALSGGPDSTALLRLLLELAPEFGWTLVVGHFDHGLRPDGAARTESLRQSTASLGVPWFSGSPAFALHPTHAALRDARYAWLRDAAKQAGAHRIATGHQRDDQVETVLFRILRGTGNRGLAGIPVRRGRVVRPLLDFSRRDLVAWLDSRGVDFTRDPANRDRRWARSRVRHDLLPSLEEETGGDIGERLLAIRRAAAEVESASSRVLDRVLRSFDEGGAAVWPTELRADALRLAARRKGVRVRGRTARCAAEQMLRLRSGQGFDLGGGVRLVRSFDSWSVCRERKSGPDGSTLSIAQTPVAGAGVVRLGGRERHVTWGPRGSSTMAGTRVALNVSEEHYPLTLRGRRPGDRIQLPGGTRKLSRVLAARRVANGERDGVPIVADCRGNVLCAVLAAPCVARGATPNANHANIVIEVEDG